MMRNGQPPQHSGKRPVRGGFVLCLLLVGSVVGTAGRGGVQPVDFSRQILPILSDNCFACHGPDEKERKGRLRLDMEAGAKGLNRDGESAVVPGDPDGSLLIERIRTEDEVDVMPPRRTGKRLTAEQVELLTRWVREGAEFTQHWAFVPPGQSELPAVKNRGWPRNEVDRFVVARLEEERLKPAPEADKRTLARRLTLDLTGLPPTPREVEAFLADKRPGAYERLVDRLLESPRYGEQMARYWMDAARYADSHGYHIDAERHMWKWRDWVIDAFNRNLPYDRFTTEQLAGDLLPEPTIDQKVATGFVRANMSTGEGGAIEEEYLAKYTFDRTETASTLWLGLTLSCARCHTHKYDPITQQEYFGLYAFFHNLDEPVMDGNRPNPDPFLKLPSSGQSRRLQELREKIEDGRARLDPLRPRELPGRDLWFQEWRERLMADVSLLRPLTVTSPNGTTLEVDESGLVQAGGSNPPKDVHELVFRPGAVRIGAFRLEILPDPGSASAGSGRAEDGSFLLTRAEAEWVPAGADDADVKPRSLAFNRAYATTWEGDRTPGKITDDQPESGWSAGAAARSLRQEALLVLREPVDISEGSELRLRLRFEGPTPSQSLARYRVSAVSGSDAVARLHPPKPPPWRVLGPFQSADPASGLARVFEPEERLDFDRAHVGVREEIRWHDRGDLEDGRRHLLVNELHGVHGVYYLTRVLRLEADREVEFTVQADDLFRLWVGGKAVLERTVKAEPGDPPGRVRLSLNAGEHRLLLKIANLQGAAHLKFSQDLNDPLGAPADIAARLLVTPGWEGDHVAELRRYYLRAADAEWRDLDSEVALWQAANEEIENSVVTTLIAKERTDRRVTRLLVRGEYDQPGEPVGPGVPAFLPSWPDGAPTNRLGFAQWLLDPAHPLTARVTVNRFWQQYYGVGLVKTAEDFGIQGEHPSHPELLDWLATEFVRTGWDVKRLQRLLVTSATYRQSSRWRPELAERDPENRLLARGPRFRADAEVVRDTALAVSGLLIERQGGPSVRPYEPPGLWETVSFNNSQKYVQDLGDGNYRRSLYTHWKRQSPPPYMLLFDAPTRETCVVRRPRTNTPLQALGLLNDPQFVEAARAFAYRLILEGGSSPRDRLVHGFQMVTARPPQRAELRILLETYEHQLAAFRADRMAAERFLSVGTFRPGAEVDPVELAAWSAMASLLLNLDESLTKS
jgi:hypothetical protein